MSTGIVLNIPDTMLEKLKETDKHISSLATKSKNTEAQVISAFRHMADNGVGYFLQQMRKANELIDLVGAKGRGMSINAPIFSNIATQAPKAIDEVNKLVEVFSKLVAENEKLRNQQLSSRGITVAQEGQVFKRETATRTKELLNNERELMNAERERERELIRADKQSARRQAEKMAR